jgi:hypothetical protein
LYFGNLGIVTIRILVMTVLLTSIFW